MMDKINIFTELKDFLEFGDEDVENLKALAPIFEVHGATITDLFYDRLKSVPETAALIEGRVESLKRTHALWLGELFAGDYGEEYFQRRWSIGLTHVRVNVPPHYVEAVVSFLRAESGRLIARELVDTELVAKRHVSLVKILDLDLMIINLAYGFERIDRLCNFTGMSKVLLQRCIEQS